MRDIPAGLQAHLDGSATTTTRLLKIVLTTGDVYGLAMLDRDIVYDDGEGEVTYYATNGFDPATLEADFGETVANTEVVALLADDSGTGITLEMVKAGELDDASWILYLVCFEDLELGHAIIDNGDVGEVRAQHGQTVAIELLGLQMRLAQSVGGIWSRTCRAIFGTPADSQTGCGVDASTLWRNDTVAAVGSETDRLFSGQALGDSPAVTIEAPARVQFLTGDNAGREFAAEVITGDDVELSEPTPYAIQVGDTFRIRTDCRKRYEEDCIGRFDNGPNFKGEPLIPVGDSTAVQAPGAQLPRSGGYLGRAAIFNETDSE